MDIMLGTGTNSLNADPFNSVSDVLSRREIWLSSVRIILNSQFANGFTIKIEQINVCLPNALIQIDKTVFGCF